MVPFLLDRRAARLSNNGMDAWDHAGQRNAPVGPMLDFTLFSNPVGPSNKAKHAMRAALKTIGRFPDPATRFLRRHLAKREGLCEENILFGEGSQRILDLLLVRSKPERVVVPAPLTPFLQRLLSRHSCETLPLPTGEEQGFIFDFGELERQLDNETLFFPGG